MYVCTYNMKRSVCVCVYIYNVYIHYIYTLYIHMLCPTSLLVAYCSAEVRTLLHKKPAKLLKDFEQARQEPSHHTLTALQQLQEQLQKPEDGPSSRSETVSEMVRRNRGCIRAICQTYTHIYIYVCSHLYIHIYVYIHVHI